MEVLLFRGRPGVGKTTLSNKLQARLHVPIIRKDDFYDAIAGFHPEHGARNQMSYGILYNMLETNRRLAGRVILDFPFNQAQDMARFSEWLQVRGIQMKSILCICTDEALWAERFNVRKAQPLPNQLITDFDELKLHYRDLSITPVDGELVVDTAGELDAVIAQIMDFVGES